ncbi:maleylpyruvate isomerase N-terminal domain-containing protein [Brachybacterium sp. JHP9]|uniref:Maleylpyruvate isomerase N-terminal domain-containing protein n=2 Tax=Brachybacterium equifaecis TaxID=2910770 RepID=A0ABT0R311_9MICO|nr:maleylpyruvate isomerase N-terminal domain-containing protein [Brachybacterium equifaecis]
MAPSRAHGWARVDCLVHVRVGLEEMLAGMSATTDEMPTVDAASYWSTWEDGAEEDPVPGILWTRRTASAYSRPQNAMEHLSMVGRGVRGTAARIDEGALAFQGHVIATGDFLATWAVELTVHHLDLDLPLGEPALAPAALTLARHTVDALHPDVADPAEDDERAVLRGFGRVTSD